MADIRHLLNVTEHGYGKTPLLMIHGFGCDKTAWRRLMPYLEDSYRLILLDLAGFGGSTPEAFEAERHATPAGHAEDMATLCDELELENAVMLGHSIGGTIGMIASTLRPGAFRQLVMVCSSARYLDDQPDYRGGYSQEQLDGLMQLMEQNYLDWASTLSRVALGDAATRSREHDLRERFLAIDPEVLRPLARSIFLGDTRHLLPQVSVPSLIVQTARDAIVPMEAAEYLQANLPDSELVVLDTGGHYPQLTDPAALAEVLPSRLTLHGSAS
ncbi:alpha/beta fold hydrolase [Billgrantia gudaonensis]|uniref:Pimeloyl-ACP methyl ester carboxylesterase n=1 Tax=Billgrantia gudaonensis TaxID=376427 RepID=A0A1G8Y567_9GAMM|nr:alpha/beta hydrolase [Halomonas gudaonensis]SDJ97992.1 Pimeloyl-ACP methyl ester carboxylesterase [Halomonas gudaonensis]